MLYDFIYIKLKNRQNYSIVTEVRRGVLPYCLGRDVQCLVFWEWVGLEMFSISFWLVVNIGEYIVKIP